MNKIHIVHIAVHLGGGAGKAISGIIHQTMDQINNEVILLEIPKNTFYIEALRNIGVPITISNDADTVAERISENDIAVVNWWGHPLMIKILAKLPIVKGRFVIWNHINGCSYPYLRTEFLNVFDKILFTTPYSEHNNLWELGQKKKILEKSALVYGMGDFNPAKICPKKSFFNDGKLTIGYAGTINYAKLNRKWLDYYEKAVENFESIEILMLGEPSKEVLEDVKKSRIKEHIKFTGYVTDVYKYYSQMDIFAYFLSNENYATTENAMLEAMASGLPVIALNHPVEAHIIEIDENGILISCPDEFAEAIRWLVMDENAKRLGEKAREYCIRKYSPETNVKVFFEVCKAASEMKRHLFTVKDVLGNNPFEFFCRQAGKERKLFEKIGNGGKITEEEIRKLPYIYRETDKASVHQFLNYFPGNRDLKILEECINRYEN